MQVTRTATGMQGAVTALDTLHGCEHVRRKTRINRPGYNDKVTGTPHGMPVTPSVTARP